MATGDQADMIGRLKALLPAGWFGGDAPILDGVLAGLAEKWAWVYDLIAYTRLQTRISTATDQWLDLIALDYFGSDLSRFPAEGDAAYRARILANLLPERGTRAAIIAVVTALTGRAPLVFEPAHTGDTGGYGGAGAAVWSGMAYGAAGGWGSLSHPFQAFITAYRPHDGGVANVAGYAASAGTLSGWVGNGDSAVTNDVTSVVPMMPGFPIVQAALPAHPTISIDLLTGAYSVIDVGTRTAAFITTTCAAGRTYEVAAWVWIPAGQPVTSITFQAEAGASSVVSSSGANVAITNAWQRVSGVFVASGGTTNLVLRINYTSAATATIYATCPRLDLDVAPYAAPGGYGVGAIEFVGGDMIDAQVPDEAIYQTIADAAPAGSIMWTRIEA